MRAILVLLLSSCSSPKEMPVDASSIDAPAPMDVAVDRGPMPTMRACPDPMLSYPRAMTFTVTETTGQQTPVPSASALVEILANEMPSASGMTDANGMVKITAPTGNARLRFSKNGFVTSYVDFAGGLRFDDFSWTLRDAAFHDNGANDSGRMWDRKNGIALVWFRSCPTGASSAADGIANATIAIDHGSKGVVYVDAIGHPNPSLSKTTELGLALDFALIPGPQKVSVTYENGITSFDFIAYPNGSHDVFLYP